MPIVHVINGADIICVASESKTQVSFQLVSVGNFVSFAFASNTNLTSTPSAITTKAVNTATPASPAAIGIRASGTAVTVHASR